MRHERRPINAQPLLDFATNRQRHGPARRLALELVERLRPGTSRLLIASWLDDPEFRYDAVDVVAREGEELDRAGAKDKARSAGRARITLRFTGPKAWGVAPAVAEFPVLAKPVSKEP
jgi:hypothetical protein